MSIVSDTLRATGILSWLASRKVNDNITAKASERALDALTRRDPTLTWDTVNKLRDASKQKVNIGQAAQELEQIHPSLRVNAYFTEDSNYCNHLDTVLNPVIDDSKGTISIGRHVGSPAVVAHELGHAANVGSKISNRRDRVSSIGNKASTAGLGVSALGNFILDTARKHNKKVNKIIPRNKFTRALLPALGIGISGLGTYSAGKAISDEEAKASEHGMGYLKSIGRSKDQLKVDREVLDAALNTYNKATLTDTISAVTSGMAAASTSSILRKWLRRAVF